MVGHYALEVPREGLQGVHPHLRHDPRENIPLLSAPNGKLERFHGSIKGECLRPGTPISLDDPVRIVGRYVEHYNQVRLHSAIGYIAPADKLAAREAEIFAARDRKLVEARAATATLPPICLAYNTNAENPSTTNPLPQPSNPNPPSDASVSR